MKTLLELLEQRAREGLVWVSFHADGRTRSVLTAEDALSRSRARAYELAALAPLRGRAVVISHPNSEEFIVDYFACLNLGAVPVPVIPGHLLRRETYANILRPVFEACRPALFLGAPESRALLPDDLAHAVYSEFPALPGDAAMVQFSSGSTSKPKGIVLSHSGLLANLAQMTESLQSGPGEIGTSWLPFYHDMGWIGAVLVPLYAGFPVHVLSPIDFLRDPALWWELVSKVRSTLTLGPDFAYRMSARRVDSARIRGLDLSSVRRALTGAEPVLPASCEAFAAKFGPVGFRASAMLPVYGLAENGLGVTFTPQPRDLRSVRVEVAQGTRDFVSCGVPLRGLRVEIRDAEGRPCAPGRRGEIYVHGPSSRIGLIEEGVYTPRDPWIATGDEGALVDGELAVTGRLKDVLIVNGKNYASVDIEKSAAETEGFRVGRIAVVAHANGVEAERPALVAETWELSPLRRRDLRQRIAAKASLVLPLQPDDVYLVPAGSLPRTTSGKVKRYQVRAELQAGRWSRLDRNFIGNLVFAKVDLGRCYMRDRLRNLFLSLRRPPKAPPWQLRLEETIIRLWSEATRQDPRQVVLDAPIPRHLADSAALLDFQARLENATVEISLSQILAFNSLQELRDYLLANHEATLRIKFGGALGDAQTCSP